MAKRTVTDENPLDPKYVPEFDFKPKAVKWANAGSAIDTLNGWDPMGPRGPFAFSQFTLDVAEGRVGSYSSTASLPTGRVLVATLHSLGLDADRLDRQYGFSKNLQRMLAESEKNVILDPDSMSGSHVWATGSVSAVHRLWACASEFIAFRAKAGSTWVVSIPETEGERTEREAKAEQAARSNDPWLDLRRLAVAASAPEGDTSIKYVAATSRAYSPNGDRNVAFLAAVDPAVVLRLLGELDEAKAKADALDAELIQLRVQVLFPKPTPEPSASAS